MKKINRPVRKSVGADSISAHDWRAKMDFAPTKIRFKTTSNVLKKAIALVIVAVMLCMSLVVLIGCGESDNIVTIDERFFVIQMNDIFLNPARFMGRTIRYEGLFASEQFGDEMHFFVERQTLGCCGNDGLIGFEVVLDGIAPLADDAWVEVTGVLESQGRRLFLRVTSLVELEERGMEFVQ